MNNNQYELIGESIWNSYRNIASILFETPIVDTEGNPLHVEISPEWEKRTQTAKHSRRPLRRQVPKIKKFLKAAMRSRKVTPLATADRVVKGMARAAVGPRRGASAPAMNPGETTFLTSRPK